MGDFDTDYLESYAEMRFLSIIGSILRVKDNLQEKRNYKASDLLESTLIALAKRDHIHVSKNQQLFNSSDCHSVATSIEPTTMLRYFHNTYEHENFKQAVQPHLSDKALEPIELT